VGNWNVFFNAFPFKSLLLIPLQRGEFALVNLILLIAELVALVHSVELVQRGLFGLLFAFFRRVREDLGQTQLVFGHYSLPVADQTWVRFHLREAFSPAAQVRVGDRLVRGQEV